MTIINLDELRWWATGSTENDQDAELDIARLAAESSVKRFCGRDFEVAGTSATARWFTPTSYYNLWVDDFANTTGLVVATDDNDDGTAEATWTAADYELHPLNGKINGETVPYNSILAVNARWWPMCNRRKGSVSVTARWGWASVPDAVKQAALIQAAADFKRKDSPHGVAAFGEFGPFRVRGTMDPRAAELLVPYRHPRVAFGIAG
jgi:hypothetical protein